MDKKFTENVILREMITLLIQMEHIPVIHHEQLGGTRVLWNALLKGEIDIYPEYTGTLFNEIMAGKEVVNLEETLSILGIKMSKPLGFNNTYAIGMKRETAIQMGITKISDLRDFPDLSFGFSNEFMAREDGWLGLREEYRLPQKKVYGLDHDMAYRGISGGNIHVTDTYSTDADIEYYDLLLLEDDLNYFSDYYGVFLFRKDLIKRYPEVLKVIAMLEGHISEMLMRKMNNQVKIQKMPESQAAAYFLSDEFGIHPHVQEKTLVWQILLRTGEHLYLVAISLSGAIFLSIPLGILAAVYPLPGKVILSITGIIQTIPSLALLVFMIPLIGIGGPPAILTLFLYSLLPIVRNTHAGLRNIAPDILESAQALGLSPLPRLFLIELPLASQSILAGIKTSAVINVGTATLGALIGAGGYGQPILTGIRLDDIELILQGAIPAAVLALLVQGLFDLIERYLVPKGLRIMPNR